VSKVLQLDCSWTQELNSSRNKATNELNKMEAIYVPLEQALAYNFKDLTKRQTKELNPLTLFSILGQWMFSYQDVYSNVYIALWKYESRNRQLPSSIEAATELSETSYSLIKQAQVNDQILREISVEVMR
jgi:ubiquitin-like 1-activating enzyme E1 A